MTLKRIICRRLGIGIKPAGADHQHRGGDLRVRSTLRPWPAAHYSIRVGAAPGGRLEMTPSVAERDIDAAGRLHHLAIWWNESQPVDCFGDRHMSDLIILIADHRPEVSFARQLHGFHSETRRENSIQRRRRTAALQMTQNAAARFFTSAFGNLARDKLPDS